MAGSTVIDSLVVTLGLDSKAFASGIKGSADELAGFTRRIAGMFLAVRGLEDVVGYFKDLHRQLAELGFTARNLGISGREISRLGEVAKLAGGQFEDAQNSIEGLQAAVFNLKFRGQMSDSLAMMQRFGVAYLDRAGHMLDPERLARNAAAAMDRLRAQGADQGEIMQATLSMGFSGGLANAIANGGEGLEKALAEARQDQRALTERTIQGQVRLDQSMTRLQAATAANSSALLSRMTPAIEAATAELRKLIDTWLPRLDRKIGELEEWLKHPPAWLASLEEHLKQLERLLGPTGSLVAALAGLSLALGAGGALVRMLGSLVAALALAPARLGAGAVGAAAPLLGKLGLVGLAGMGGYEIGKFLTDVLPKMLGAKEGLGEWLGGAAYDLLHPQDELQEQAVSARLGAAPSAPGAAPSAPAALVTPTAPRPSAAAAASAHAASSPPTAMAGAPVTNVQIDSITVNTRATDPQGIAAGIHQAVRQKFLVGIADPGLA